MWVQDHGSVGRIIEVASSMIVNIQKSSRGVFSSEDIASLQTEAGGRLPEDFATFMQTMGPVSFGDDGVTFDVTWQRVDGEDMTADEDEEFQDDFMLLVFSGIESIKKHIRFLHGAYSKDGEPMIDKSLFPFSSDVDRGFLLMSLAEDTYGKIYVYFPADDPWGTGNNNYLGYIAASFTDFIENKIRPYE